MKNNESLKEVFERFMDAFVNENFSEIVSTKGRIWG